MSKTPTKASGIRGSGSDGKVQLGISDFTQRTLDRWIVQYQLD